MSIDDQLMRTPAARDQGQDQKDDFENSSDRAGSLREAQREEQTADQKGNNIDLRSAVMAAKRQQALAGNSQEANGDPGDEKALSAGSSKILQAAYRNIIYTFGFSFFYVYIHLFLKGAFGSRYFAPLGSEWMDQAGLTLREREKRGENIKTTEVFGVGLISFILFVVIIFDFSVIAMIAEVVKNPIRSFFHIALDGIYSFLTGK